MDYMRKRSREEGKFRHPPIHPHPFLERERERKKERERERESGKEYESRLHEVKQQMLQHDFSRGVRDREEG